MFDRIPLNVSFRRALVGENLLLWQCLVISIAHTRLNVNKDLFRWAASNTGRFTVRSMYLSIMNYGHIVQDTTIWKMKMPLKIKIFMWYMKKGIVLTKDNLVKRHWQGSIKVCFLFCK